MTAVCALVNVNQGFTCYVYIMLEGERSSALICVEQIMVLLVPSRVSHSVYVGDVSMFCCTLRAKAKHPV